MHLLVGLLTILFSCIGGTFGYPLASHMAYPLEAHFKGFSCSVCNNWRKRLRCFSSRHMGGDLVAGLIVFKVSDSPFLCFRLLLLQRPEVSS